MSDEERPEQVEWIPDNVWADIVEHIPIPSVDLVVDCADGVLLARRQNEPAKGEWFVPGGRVRKGERLYEAVHRVANKELGVSVTIDRKLGAYDHFYEVADIANSGGNTMLHTAILSRQAQRRLTLTINTMRYECTQVIISLNCTPTSRHISVTGMCSLTN